MRKSLTKTQINRKSRCAFLNIFLSYLLLLSAFLVLAAGAREAGLYTASVLYGDAGGMKVAAQGDVIAFMAAKSWHGAGLENEACAHDLHCTMQKNNKGMVIINPGGLWIVDRPGPSIPVEKIVPSESLLPFSVWPGRSQPYPDPSITFVSTTDIQPAFTLTTLNTGIPAIDKTPSVQLVNSDTLQWLAEMVNKVSTTKAMDSLDFDEALSAVIKPSSSQERRPLTRIVEDDQDRSSLLVSTSPMPTPQITQIKNRIWEAGLVSLEFGSDQLTIRPSPGHPHNSGSGTAGSFTFTARQVPTDTETPSSPQTATSAEPTQTPESDGQGINPSSAGVKCTRSETKPLDEREIQEKRARIGDNVSEYMGDAMQEDPENISEIKEMSSDENAQPLPPDSKARPPNVIPPELKQLMDMAITRCDSLTVEALIFKMKELEIADDELSGFLVDALSDHRCDYDYHDVFDVRYLLLVARHRFYLSRPLNACLSISVLFSRDQDDEQGVVSIRLEKDEFKCDVNLNFWCKADRECAELLFFYLGDSACSDFRCSIEILDQVMQECWSGHRDFQDSFIKGLPAGILQGQRLASSRFAQFFQQALQAGDADSLQENYSIPGVVRIFRHTLDYKILTDCSKTQVIRLLMGRGRPVEIAYKIALSHPEEPLELQSVPDLFLGEHNCKFDLIYQVRDQALQYFIEGGGDLNGLTWNNKPLLNMFIDYAKYSNYCSTGLKHLVSYGLVPFFIQPLESARRLRGDMFRQHMLNEIKRIQVRLYHHDTDAYLHLQSLFSHLRNPVNLVDLPLPHHFFRDGFKPVLDQLREEAATQPDCYKLEAPAPLFPFETPAAPVAIELPDQLREETATEVEPPSQETAESRSLLELIVHFFQWVAHYIRGERNQ